MEKAFENKVEQIFSTNKNFLVENIFAVNHFSYFIRIKFLIA